MPSARTDEANLDNSILQLVLSGDFRAIARMITLVENGAPEAVSYLRRLFPHSGRCFTVGITGSPGAGKSTLVDRLASHYRGEDKKVGILAVDPTSPYTGGSILGDRIRMQSRSLDTGTFIRSMATRGALGGLARATNDAQLVLDAAGFDVVLIETVGVGQAEVDIARTADATIVMLVPGMGDDIQTMKAGIMEIGDIFVINKADHAGADRVEVELKALLELSSRPDRWKPLIVRTVASAGEGVEECAAAVAEFRSFRHDSRFQRAQSIQVQKERLLELVRSKVVDRLLRDGRTALKLDELAGRVAARDIDPFSAAEELLENLRGREAKD